MLQTIYSPTGKDISCKSWETEALLRLLMNSLDPRVAENGQDLIVYGGTGKAARSKTMLRAIIKELQQLDSDSTLLIQSGKPVASFRTFSFFPRVLASAAMVVPAWATWKEFSRLEEKGLTMYGQATAASWAYIGVQGVLQATFETMSEVANRYFNGSLKGKIVLTSGLGGMGSAQPLSVTMNGGVAIVVEIDESKIQKRLMNNYCDIMAHTIDQALQLAEEAAQTGRPLAIALVGNAADVYCELVEKGVTPDIVTDQTAAHDLLHGYIPSGVSLEQAYFLRNKKPEKYVEMAMQTVTAHVAAMKMFQERGAVVFDYGNNIRGQAKKAGYEEAFDFPGFVSEYLRPLYCEGRGPCRWVALSGDPGDIYKIDEVILSEFKSDERICRWIRYVQDKIYFYGLPARTCWLNYKERDELGEIINHMVASGRLLAPVAITRDHSEGSTMAAPTRETEGMLDGSDAVADWPILNGLLNACAGASMVSIQHGGGVGIGNSIHSGMTAVADGSIESFERLQRLLKIDPGLNIIRHADAGYSTAQSMIDKLGIKKPL
ncbi:urocanate hydratase [Aneurinibacillus migulanus]|uniref:urocanate hydratase n=1 Tax=Aneurinibacillus migulanus TaxID=47500 RepID=UPI0005B84002|nr:urocanate hydratase [Aneurinibacillus migulanus]KIV52563.1 urocanate hydratase [Aneurinibacillus migulanus]KPD09336.1 urocanate hydratase [Aneurinibacillus migulanus]MCP1359063.1 urocanate hydratase [Aneurinibacillus migulanus]